MMTGPTEQHMISVRESWLVMATTERLAIYTYSGLATYLDIG
jgi:hypothetical protein